MPARHAKRLSMDAITIPDDAVEEFVKFLEAKLSPEDFSALKKMLANSQQSDSDEDETDAANDEPPPFKNAPKTGGSMAADSRGKTFADRWPETARIGLL